MADANPTLMLLTIFLLVTSATAGCIRINLSHSGMRCTPGDACPVICAKIKGIDGKCEDGACMCTICDPSYHPRAATD
ncbi:uncharacterized protein [Zea mays]|uniref:Defensin-like protein n=1 Tax=Zea mays TaxID=4577 RepID=C0PIR2_MAIZE|nr:uncharacterized protein LOC100383743 [Zea mays]ACN35078.1 unknown [Zea mays]|eukprot:XP_008649834.1 uncharacterized protein LOC100383743 [Zea mays]